MYQQLSQPWITDYLPPIKSVLGQHCRSLHGKLALGIGGPKVNLAIAKLACDGDRPGIKQGANGPETEVADLSVWHLFADKIQQ